MKPLTRKILESGLITKAVAEMMEQWGHLDGGASDLVGRKKLTEDTLQRFVDQIEALVDDHSFKEVSLEVPISRFHELYSRDVGFFSAAEDRLGRLVVHFRYHLIPGSILYKEDKVTPSHRIMSIETVYVSDLSYFNLLTVESLEGQHAVV